MFGPMASTARLPATFLLHQAVRWMLQCSNMSMGEHTLQCLHHRKQKRLETEKLDERFEYFLFFCSGGGKGHSEAPGGGGVGFSLKIPGGGEVSQKRGGGVRGREGVCEEFRGGGGLNIFFRGRNARQKNLSHSG